MGPKKVTSATPSSKRVRNTIEQKKEIIEKHESGMRVTELARVYGKSTSTICTILAQKSEIKAADVAKGVNMLTKRRSRIVDDVEKLLLVWINEKQLAGDSISEAIISEKARRLHTDLVKKMPATSTDATDFKASRGWFEKFKRRSGIHSVVRHGEGASSDKCAAEKFVQEFKEYVETEGFLPQQVFNCDETGLFWKKMPKRTYITKEEKALPGHKPMKDRLTLLFCANASGDLKVKPLLVYHSENPRVFKKHQIMKDSLCVMWRANSNAWVTRVMFFEWLNFVFGPSVKKYLLENELPLKCLLVMDNAPSHPPVLEDQLYDEFSFITVKFLPPNTTPLIQPMDQQVISNFKKLYTKEMFERCFQITNSSELTLKEFWKNHFTILTCLGLIDRAWKGVTVRCLNSAWRRLWPECVHDRDFEGFKADDPVDPTPVVQTIVLLGESLGLEVSGEDVEELVEGHNKDLTTEELQDLHREQQQITEEENASEQQEEGEEENPGKKVPTSVLKEVLAKWLDVQGFLENFNPNKAAIMSACNNFSKDGMAHLMHVLRKRQKQSSMDRFLVRQVSSDSEAGPSGIKRQRREVTPDRALVPEDPMEGDSPSKK